MADVRLDRSRKIGGFWARRRIAGRVGRQLKGSQSNSVAAEPPGTEISPAGGIQGLSVAARLSIAVDYNGDCLVKLALDSISHQTFKISS